MLTQACFLTATPLIKQTFMPYARLFLCVSITVFVLIKQFLANA